MKEELSKSSLWQFLPGLMIGIMILIFSLTQGCEPAELATYDWRFRLRNSLFGPPPVDSRLGSIAIDDQSIEIEGRWSGWTRDKYADVVRFLGDNGVRQIGFDIYFIEKSPTRVSQQQLLTLEQIDRQAIIDLFENVDCDELFRDSIADAGNVYLALYLGRAADDLDLEEIRAKMKLRSSDEDAALEVIRNRSPRLMVDAEKSTLTRAFYFELPLKILRDAARGFAYAQTEADIDGARRRYPLVYQYEDVLFPSIALAMICDHLQVPLKTVEVWPGDYIKLPGARFTDGTVKDIEIPIDARGTMHVNWVGKWEETFLRYSHIELRRAANYEKNKHSIESTHVGQDGSITSEGLRGKILFYGLTAIGSSDLGVTPFQGDYPMVGIYANVFNTVLQQIFIRRLPAGINGGLILILSVLLPLLVMRLGGSSAVFLIFGIGLVYISIAVFAFVFLGIWMDMAASLMTLVLCGPVYGYVISYRAKRVLEQTQMQEFEEELQTAHDMQMGLMPTESPRLQGFDIAGRCIPANHVGGDFYQYFSQKGKLSVSLADVTGHAMEAAVPVMMFSGILKSQMEIGGSVEEIFGRLNRSLHGTLDKRTFVCFTMGELDTEKRTFHLANGGCPYPYHIQASTGDISELQLDAYPLAIRPDSEYQTMDVQLEQGDRIVFCSDGIIEAENGEGEIFGFERTAETIRQACAEGLSAEALIDHLIGAVKDFTGDEPQGDDMTVVVLKVEG